MTWNWEIKSECNKGKGKHSIDARQWGSSKWDSLQTHPQVTGSTLVSTLVTWSLSCGQESTPHTPPPLLHCLPSRWKLQRANWAFQTVPCRGFPDICSPIFLRKNKSKSNGQTFTSFSVYEKLAVVLFSPAAPHTSDTDNTRGKALASEVYSTGATLPPLHHQPMDGLCAFWEPGICTQHYLCLPWNYTSNPHSEKTPPKEVVIPWTAGRSQSYYRLLTLSSVPFSEVLLEGKLVFLTLGLLATVSSLTESQWINRKQSRTLRQTRGRRQAEVRKWWGEKQFTKKINCNSDHEPPSSSPSNSISVLSKSKEHTSHHKPPPPPRRLPSQQARGCCSDSVKCHRAAFFKGHGRAEFRGWLCFNSMPCLQRTSCSKDPTSVHLLSPSPTKHSNEDPTPAKIRLFVNK